MRASRSEHSRTTTFLYGCAWPATGSSPRRTVSFTTSGTALSASWTPRISTVFSSAIRNVLKASGRRPGALTRPAPVCARSLRTIESQFPISFAETPPVDFEVLKDYLRPYYLKRFYFHIRPESRANYLAECWTNPHFPISTRLRDLIAHNPSRPDLLFLPMSDWHARIQRTQHLAMGLGELGHRCFFVNT